MTAPTDTAASAPAQLPIVRVSVLTPSIQVDVDLGYTIPLAEIVPALLRQLNTFLEAKGQTPLIGGKDFNKWTLGRIGYAPIPLRDTLKTAGVEDGDLLILQSVNQPQSPAMFDDVIDAVAQLQASTKASWNDKSAERLAYGAILFFAVSFSFFLNFFHMGWKYGPSLIGILVAVVLVISGIMQARFYKNTILANILQIAAFPLLFTGTYLLPAELSTLTYPSDSPNLSAIQYAVGFIAIATVASVLPTISLTGIVFHIAFVTIGLLGGFGACLGILWLHHTAGIGAIVAGLSIIAISAAPRTAIILSKIPIPHIPSIGDPLQPSKAKPAIEPVGTLGSVVLPEAAALERRTLAAYEYHTGALLGATLCATGGAIVCAKYSAADNDWRGLILALMISIILCLRGRVHADRLHVSMMVIAGVITSAVSLTFIGKQAEGWLKYFCLLAYLLLIPICLISAAAATKTKTSPLTKRSIEIFGYTLLTLLIPMIFWVADIYAIARHR